MQAVKLEHFPNNEVRLTSYPVRAGRFFYGQSQNETEDETEIENLSTPPLSLPAISELSDQVPTSASMVGSLMGLKRGYGMECARTKFGLRGKRTIMRAGGAIDKSDYNVKNCLFLTGTLAGSTDAAVQTIADWSGYIVDRLKSWLSKFKLDRKEFYVWELQDRGALHLHYFVALDTSEEGVPILEGFHKQWRKLLLNVSEKSGIDTFEQEEGGSWKDDESKPITDAQRVYRSVAAYMAKYCSKRAGVSNLNHPCPSRWWGVSRPLTSLLRSLSSIRERIFPHCTAAKRWLEDRYAEMCSLSDKVMSYASKCGRSRVSVCYHQSSEFKFIRTSLFKEPMSDFVVLRDGSHRHLGIDLKRELGFIVGMIPDCPLLTDRKYRLHQYANGISEPLDEPNLQCLAALVNSICFLDSSVNSEAYELFIPKERLVKISALSWTLYKKLRQARDVFFPPMGDDCPPTLPPLETIAPSQWQQLDLGLSGKLIPSPLQSRWN